MASASGSAKIIKDFFVLIVAIAAFAALGVFIARWQYGTTDHQPDDYNTRYDTSDLVYKGSMPYDNKYSLPGFPSVTIAESDSEMKMVTSYAIIGGLVGFVLGILNTYASGKKFEG